MYGIPDRQLQGYELYTQALSLLEAEARGYATVGLLFVSPINHRVWPWFIAYPSTFKRPAIKTNPPAPLPSFHPPLDLLFVEQELIPTTSAHVCQKMADSVYDANLYGYTPTKAVCVVLTLLFALSTVLHVGQAIRGRLWWLFPSAILCGLMETIGWAARWYSASDVTNRMAFIIQTTLTVIAPTPLVATNFIVLGRLIGMLGDQYSRLPAKLYTKVFLTGDIVSFLIQGAGGGLAASAASGGGKDPKLGENVTIGGIIFQLIMIGLYIVCAVEFFWRYNKDRPVRAVSVVITNGVPQPTRGVLTTRLLIMSVAIMFTTVCLVIRAIYRAVEFTDGWNGPVRTTELYFNVLDGAMIILCMCILNIVHPGIFLYPSKPQADNGTYRLGRRRHEGADSYAFNN